MNEQEREMVRRAAELRGRALTSEQAARKAEVDRRAKRIQEVGPRPVDGVTFGSGKPPKK